MTSSAPPSTAALVAAQAGSLKKSKPVWVLGWMTTGTLAVPTWLELEPWWCGCSLRSSRPSLRCDKHDAALPAKLGLQGAGWRTGPSTGADGLLIKGAGVGCSSGCLLCRTSSGGRDVASQHWLRGTIASQHSAIAGTGCQIRPWPLPGLGNALSRDFSALQPAQQAQQTYQ